MTQTARWLLGLGTLLALAGCSQQTINSAQHDAQKDATAVDQGARKVAQDAQPQLKKAALGARVTAALGAANVHGVRVDAGPDGVTLVGRVGSREDRARAIQIAHDTLGPKEVVRTRITLSPP